MERLAAHPGQTFAVALSAALIAASSLSFVGCKAAPPKNYLHAEWSNFESANPTEIAIVRVDAAKLPRDLSPDVFRDSMRDEILAHRYSPLSFDYVDRGNLLNASATKSESTPPPPVAKLELFVTAFDTSRYETMNTIRVTGDFLFTDVSSQRLLGSVKAEQTMDFSAEARRNVSKNEAIRLAAVRFVEASLAPMPVRRVEATASSSK